MPRSKMRATFTIDPDIYKEAQAIVKLLPFPSLSWYVEASLAQLIDTYWPTLRDMQGMEPQEQADALRKLFADVNIKMAKGLDELVHTLQSKGGKSE